jgi:hypothetical protein
MVLLAKHGVVSLSWDDAEKWSSSRRLAALIIIGESNGGHFNWDQMKMTWPEAQ